MKTCLLQLGFSINKRFAPTFHLHLELFYPPRLNSSSFLMASPSNAPCHSMMDADVFCQWKRLHEILSGGPAVAVDKVVVGRELDALLQQLDAFVLLDREVRDAFLAFSSGLPKILIDFSHSRATLLRIEDLKRQIEYSSEECQSLIRLAKTGRKVSHEMHGHLQAVIREIDGVGTPEPPISFEHSQQRLNLLFGELRRTTDFLERSSQESNMFYEHCVSLDAVMEDDISEYRRLLEDKRTHQLSKKEAE